jgi:hypothetical protein
MVASPLGVIAGVVLFAASVTVTRSGFALVPCYYRGRRLCWDCSGWDGSEPNGFYGYDWRTGKLCGFYIGNHGWFLFLCNVDGCSRVGLGPSACRYCMYVLRGTSGCTKVGLAVAQIKALTVRLLTWTTGR